MDYIKPKQVVEAIVEGAVVKAALGTSDLSIRSFLSGVLLAFATVLAGAAALQTGLPIVGAIVFPVGLVIIVVLGFELLTGNFALLPMALWEKRIAGRQVLRNWGLVFLGNLAGSLFFAGLLWVSLTATGTVDAGAIGEWITGVAQTKTLAYKEAGVRGMATVLVRALLCNWMVCLGVVMALTSSSTVGKIVAAWLPIFTFFALGFEHAVVNMFIIPAGMLLGAPVSVADWWLWNQIPVTLGNLVAGSVFVGWALHVTYGKRGVESPEPESPGEPAAAAPSRQS